MKTTLLVCLCSLLINSPLVFAKEAANKHHHKKLAHHHKEISNSLTIKLLDRNRNGNGEVNLVEFKKARFVNLKIENMFNHIDKNNDGVINVNELKRYKKPKPCHHKKHGNILHK